VTIGQKIFIENEARRVKLTSCKPVRSSGKLSVKRSGWIVTILN